MAEEKRRHNDNSRTENTRNEKEKVSNPAIPQEHRPAMNPGEDAIAKTGRKGAGQQQKSGGNPVVNS